MELVGKSKFDTSIWSASHVESSTESSWEKAALPGENRSEIDRQIKQNCDNVLQLSDFHISELPPLPENITELTLRRCVLKDLKGDLSQLETLTILGCELKELSLKGLLLSNLKNLNVWGCKQLEKITGPLEKISRLAVENCPTLSEIPGDLKSVVGLTLHHTNLPAFDYQLPELLRLSLGSFAGVKDFKFIYAPQLQFFYASNCDFTELPDKSHQLEEVSLKDCANVKEIPDGQTQVKRLSVENCASFTTLPAGLESLTLKNCASVTTLPKGLTQLQSLSIKDCVNFKGIPDGLLKLEGLFIKGCANFKMEEILSQLKSLFAGDRFNYLTKLPKLLLELQSISASDCSELNVQLWRDQGFITLYTKADESVTDSGKSIRINLKERSVASKS